MNIQVLVSNTRYRAISFGASGVGRKFKRSVRGRRVSWLCESGKQPVDQHETQRGVFINFFGFRKFNQRPSTRSSGIDDAIPDHCPRRSHLVDVGKDFAERGIRCKNCLLSQEQNRKSKSPGCEPATPRS